MIFRDLRQRLITSSCLPEHSECSDPSGRTTSWHQSVPIARTINTGEASLVIADRSNRRLHTYGWRFLSRRSPRPEALTRYRRSGTDHSDDSSIRGEAWNATALAKFKPLVSTAPSRWRNTTRTNDTATWPELNGSPCVQAEKGLTAVRQSGITGDDPRMARAAAPLRLTILWISRSQITNRAVLQMALKKAATKEMSTLYQ